MKTPLRARATITSAFQRSSSPLAALLLLKISPIFFVVAPCQRRRSLDGNSEVIVALTLILLLAIGCGPAVPATTETPRTKTTAQPIATPDRSKLPTPGIAREWTPPAIVSWKRPSGLEVWHVAQKGAPLISIRLVLPHGSATDPKDKAGLTGLMSDMLDEGAGDKDALALGKALQRLATDYGTSPSPDGITLLMNMLADTFEPSMALLADIIQRPHLSAPEFERRRGLWVAQAITRLASANNARTVVAKRVLFGEGYGSQSAYGIRASLKKIKLRDIKKQYEMLIKPQGATLIIVGDIGRAAIDAVLDKKFKDWKGKPTAAEAKPQKSDLPIKAIYRIDFPNSSQSSIAVVRRTPGAHAQDYFAARIYNWSFGGSFSSRLNLNLREDKGYTYGARAGFWRWKQAGAYALTSQVKRETTRPSIDEMQKELADLAGDRPLAKDEYRHAISDELLGFPGRFERLQDIAQQLANAKLMGRPPLWVNQWPERIRQVTLAEARASARSHATVNDFAIVVAGDMKKLGGSLTTMNRPVYDCDPEGQCSLAE